MSLWMLVGGPRHGTEQEFLKIFGLTVFVKLKTSFLTYASC